MKVKKGQVVGALLASVALATAACGTSSGTTAGSSGGKTTITIWNDALAASSSTVPEAKSFLTKGVALFEKQNPDINVKVIPEPFAASTSFDTLLELGKGAYEVKGEDGAR